MKLSTVVLLLVASEIHEGSARCSVRIKDLKNYQPLFLNPGTRTTWPVSDTGYMEFSTDQRIELFCSSSYTFPLGISGSQLATCDSGKTFKIRYAKYDITNVRCASWPALTVRKTGASCNGGIVVETGFEVGPRFIRQMEICFNEALEVTRYVNHTLQPGTSFHQSNVHRTVFGKHGFFSKKDVDTMYKQNNIKDAFQEQLGRNYNTNIIRGHIAAMVDFAYGTQQRGTFIFLNAAPQWQSINNGNWRKTEDNTRAWVTRTRRNVNCYSGVYGIATLPNASGVQTPLYLDFHKNGQSLIPIPMLYFRVIIEPSTNTGVVLITVNNPHQYFPSYRLCTNVSQHLTWLTWRQNVNEGISYACEVNDFVRANPYLPRFNVNGLLV